MCSRLRLVIMSAFGRPRNLHLRQSPSSRIGRSLKSDRSIQKGLGLCLTAKDVTMRRSWWLVSTMLAVFAWGVAASSGGSNPLRNSPSPSPPPPALGDPLLGLGLQELARFNTGKQAFLHVEDVAGGLGPV